MLFIEVVRGLVGAFVELVDMLQARFVFANVLLDQMFFSSHGSDPVSTVVVN